MTGGRDPAQAQKAMEMTNYLKLKRKFYLTKKKRKKKKKGLINF